MTQHRFTAAEIAAKLRVARRMEVAGESVGEICRQLGVAELTYLRWHKKYADLGARSVARVRQLEEDNARLHRALLGVQELLGHLMQNLGAEPLETSHPDSLPRPRQALRK